MGNNPIHIPIVLHLSRSKDLTLGMLGMDLNQIQTHFVGKQRKYEVKEARERERRMKESIGSNTMKNR